MPNPEPEPENKNARAKKRASFTTPTPEEVVEYCRERRNQVDPKAWYDHYESNGWKVGRNAMKDWKAAVRSWEHNGFRGGNGSSMKPEGPPPTKIN